MPNIFTDEELEAVYSAMKPMVVGADMQPTRTNLYALFTKNVQANLHTVLSMRCLSDGWWFDWWFNWWVGGGGGVWWVVV